MTTKVSENGLLLSKELLGNAEEVEIRREHGVIIIVPRTARDPILELGRHPVVTEVDDASINHDAYLQN